MSDFISRQAAIDAIADYLSKTTYTSAISFLNTGALILARVPSAEPEIKPIDYRDCSNALLRMWMDKVITDGEYKRIMDKLNAHWEMENE